MSSSLEGGRRLLHFFKMADAAALTACHDVEVMISAELWMRLPLPASSFHENIGRGERSSDRPENALARLVDLLDSVETKSPRL